MKKSASLIALAGALSLMACTNQTETRNMDTMSGVKQEQNDRSKEAKCGASKTQEAKCGASKAKSQEAQCGASKSSN